MSRNLESGPRITFIASSRCVGMRLFTHKKRANLKIDPPFGNTYFSYYTAFAVSIARSDAVTVAPLMVADTLPAPFNALMASLKVFPLIRVPRESVLTT